MAEIVTDRADDPVGTQDLYFNVGGVRLFAKRYGKKGGFPVIALHGWMDNAASFELLAPKLTGCEVICIDCAGHGLSGHRLHLGAYNIWQDITELYAVADQLGWQKFSLLGHSRGAICCFLAASTLPERITHLALIEGVYPSSSTAEETPEVLATSVKALLASQNRAKRYYDSFDQAVSARAKGFVPVSMDDARVLAMHGTEQGEKGYFWRYDYKLAIGSEIHLSSEQLMAFQARISIPSLVILADDGMFIGNPAFMAAFELFHQARLVTLPGEHHLHMHTQSALVSEHILRYFFDELAD